MKEWPEDKTTILRYEDLITPVRKAFLTAYRLVSRKKKSIPYEGYNFGGQSLVTISPPDEQLQEEMISYHKERGRDILDIMLMIVFNLGMEQGRRIEAQNTKSTTNIYMNHIKVCWKQGTRAHYDFKKKEDCCIQSHTRFIRSLSFASWKGWVGLVRYAARPN